MIGAVVAVVVAVGVAVLLISRMGKKKRDDDVVRVRPMSWDGGTLGFARGTDIWIADVLETDADADKDVRVAIHELGHVRESLSGHPDAFAEDWYLHDADQKPPFYPVPAAEAKWFASGPAMSVLVENDNPWLGEVVDAACARINEAAGSEAVRRLPWRN